MGQLGSYADLSGACICVRGQLVDREGESPGGKAFHWAEQVMQTLSRLDPFNIPFGQNLLVVLLIKMMYARHVGLPRWY